MPKELIEDPTGCIQYLHKMLEDGTPKVKIGSTFGQWYLYGNLVCIFFLVIFIVLQCPTMSFNVHFHQLTIVFHCPSFIVLCQLLCLRRYLMNTMPIQCLCRVVIVHKKTRFILIVLKTMFHVSIALMTCRGTRSS